MIIIFFGSSAAFGMEQNQYCSIQYGRGEHKIAPKHSDRLGSTILNMCGYVPEVHGIIVNCIVDDTLIGIVLTWLDLSFVATLLGAGREILILLVHQLAHTGGIP